MKPYVICHMVSSIDGRILNSRWRPKQSAPGDLFETLHEKLGGDAWLVGRVTGQEFSRGKGYPQSSAQSLPREPWFTRRDAKSYGVVLDAHGKIAWGRADIGGDPIVVALTEAVPDSHLLGLRDDQVSYFFAGKVKLDLQAVLETLNRELGVKRLLMEGGGDANGELLRAGLIDEISLAINPAVDGARGAPSVFDSAADAAGQRAPLASMVLDTCEVLDGGAVWLRYKVTNDKPV